MAEPAPLPYPGPDVSIAGRMIATIVTLNSISIPLFCLRIRARMVSVSRFGLDDLTIAIAILCAIFQSALTLAAISYGFGRHNYYISPEDQVKAGQLVFISQPPWSWSLSLAKISIAFMILRIKNTLPWRIFLYAMILVQLASAISANVVQFSICNPLAAFWDLSLRPHAKCWPPNAAQTCIIVNAIVGIVTDVIFTCLPLSFIRSINRPLREKIVLSFLMCLGLLTSIASIIKTTKVKAYGKTDDTLYDGVALGVWSIVEQQLGIIAACIPCLKALGERFLRRIGMLSTDATSSPRASECSRSGSGSAMRWSYLGLGSRTSRENKDSLRLSDLDRPGREQNRFSTQREHSVMTDVEGRVIQAPEPARFP